MALFKKKKPTAAKGGAGKTLFWAVLFGVIAAVLAGLYIKQRADQYLASLQEQQAAEISVVVAAQDLQVGSVVSEDLMAVRAIPADVAPTGVITPNQFGAYQGRVITQRLDQGTPLLRSFIADGVVLDFSDTLKHGTRAITIQVDELKSIGGLARPGNRVDILALLPPGTRNSDDEKDVVLTVLQNVKVLATGEEAEGSYQEKVLRGRGQVDSRYTNVTLEVDPRQGALLTQAADKGELVTLLRNREDTTGSTFAEVSPADLYSNAQRIAEEARQKAENRSLDNLVVRDGKIYTADGVEVTDPNLIVKDGVVMTKDGVVLNGKGLVIDDDGNIRTADGQRVSADNIAVNEDGQVVTGDGIVLGDDVKVREDGLLQAADGTLMTKDGRVLGVLGEDVVMTEDGLLQKSDGTLMTKDGKVLGKNLKRTKDGFLVDENGRVMTKDGQVLSGVSVNENGEVVTADGRVLRADEIVVNEDGSITDKNGEVIAGVSASEIEQRIGDDPAGDDVPAGPGFIEFLAGGVSQDGIATVAELPVLGQGAAVIGGTGAGQVRAGGSRATQGSQQSLPQQPLQQYQQQQLRQQQMLQQQLQQQQMENMEEIQRTSPGSAGGGQ